MWIKNTDGKQDAVLTMTLIGFIIVVVKVLFGGMTFVISGNSYTFGMIGASEIGAILTPTLGAYVARRYTDAKCKHDEIVIEEVEVEEHCSKCGK